MTGDSQMRTRRSIPPGDGDGDIDGNATPAMVARHGTPLPIAAQIGRYRVIERLGQGGMGAVFRAHDPDLGRDVALKVIRSDLPELDQSRLVREAQALARLSHENVISVLDVGITGTRVFVAMELISGITLRDWFEDTERGVDETLDTFVAAGRGLAAAHEAGIVHRDFKPDNVMVEDDGAVRVLDFGLATPVGDGENFDTRQSGEDGITYAPEVVPISTPTRTGAMLGTPAYMPVEQLRARPVDERADQFAFAVSLWEALAGRRPFWAPHTDELIDVIERGDPETPPRRRMPPRIRRVLRRALAADPDVRWPDMPHLLAALDRARRPSIARRLGGWSILGAATVAAVFGVTELRGEDPRCEAARSSMDAAWSPGRRDALAAGVASSGLPYAATTAIALEDRIDAYAARWSEVHAQVCAEPDRPTPSHGVACLEQARRDLEALIAVLSDESSDTATRAVEAVESLSLPTACVAPEPASSDPGRLRPRDPTAVAELQSRISLERARLFAGAVEASHEAAVEIATQAEALGYPPLSLEAWMFVGGSARAYGDFSAAEAAYEKAFFLAQDLGDPRAEIAGTKLVLLLAELPDRLRDADEWARHVRSGLVLRPSALTEASLEQALGHLAIERTRLDVALEHFERQLEILRSSPDASDERLAGASFNLAEVHSRAGRAELALSAQREGLALASKSRGEDHPQTALSMVNLATMLLQNGAFDEAIETSAKAIALERRVLPAGHRELAGSVANHGMLLAGSGRCDEAGPFFEEGMELYARAMGEQHPTIGRIVFSQGLCAFDAQRWAEALGHFERARAYFEQASTTGVAIGRTLYNIGICHRRLGQTEPSLHALRDALVAMQGQPDSEGIVPHAKEILAAAGPAN